ncbi:MAG: hypothetical protein K8U57_20135 [Planctomycetes bacterium]|nr:hypothetical protein [Planctomycetota bacterium]
MPAEPEKQQPKIPRRRLPAKPKENDSPDMTEYEPIFPVTPEERKGQSPSHIWGPIRLAEQRAARAKLAQPQPPTEPPPEPPPAT